MTELKRPFDTPIWCVVELMGHTVIAGQVTDQPMFGKSMLRIDHPETERRQAFTQYISPEALYRVTPVTESVAREIAAKNDARPAVLYNLEFQLSRMLSSGDEGEKELEYDDDFDEDYDETPQF
jgi:hypothetical protein